MCRKYQNRRFTSKEILDIYFSFIQIIQKQLKSFFRIYSQYSCSDFSLLQKRFFFFQVFLCLLIEKIFFKSFFHHIQITFRNFKLPLIIHSLVFRCKLLIGRSHPFGNIYRKVILIPRILVCLIAGDSIKQVYCFHIFFGYPISIFQAAPSTQRISVSIIINLKIQKIMLIGYRPDSDSRQDQHSTHDNKLHYCQPGMCLPLTHPQSTEGNGSVLSSFSLFLPLLFIFFCYMQTTQFFHLQEGNQVRYRYHSAANSHRHQEMDCREAIA